MASSELDCSVDEYVLYNKCFGDETDVDLTICVEDKRIGVCGKVLLIASPVFKSMIEGDFKEGKEKIINLPGKKYSEIVVFLECIYPDILQQITDKNVFELLPLADEYQVTILRKRCVERLRDQVNSATAIDHLYKVLSVAVTFDIEPLKIRCIQLASRGTLTQLSDCETRWEIPENIKLEIRKIVIKRFELERQDDSLVHNSSTKVSLKSEISSTVYRFSKNQSEALDFLQKLRLTKRFFKGDKDMVVGLINSHKQLIPCIMNNSFELQPEHLPYFENEFLDQLPVDKQKVLLRIQNLCLNEKIVCLIKETV